MSPEKLYIYIQSAYDMCATFILFRNDLLTFSLTYISIQPFANESQYNEEENEKMGNGEQVEKRLEFGSTWVICWLSFCVRDVSIRTITWVEI